MLVKLEFGPPATTSPLGKVVNACTVVPMPPAIDNQVVPFQRATSGTSSVPAQSKRPPATSSPLPATVSASTAGTENERVRPGPSGDHAVPFHRAMLLTAVPPALLKRPAATRSPFGITASAFTSGKLPETPPPNADHVPATWSKVARKAQDWLPTATKEPPITSCGPRGPAPSGSHSNEQCTVPPTPG